MSVDTVEGKKVWELGGRVSWEIVDVLESSQLFLTSIYFFSDPLGFDDAFDSLSLPRDVL